MELITDNVLLIDDDEENNKIEKVSQYIELVGFFFS